MMYELARARLEELPPCNSKAANPPPKSPRGRRKMKVVRSVFILLAVGLIFIFGFGYGRWYSTRPKPKAGRRILYYVDAMHPWYKSDKPGIAPDCGMKLEPVYADGTMGTPAPRSGAQDPPIPRSQGPQIHVRQARVQSGDRQRTGAGLCRSTAPTPETIQISAEKQQLIGMRTARRMDSDGQAVRFAGRVVPDETRDHAHPRQGGRLDRPGLRGFHRQARAKGDPLLTIYSPEALATQQEYLLALKARDHAPQLHGESPARAPLVAAARRRLELWDISRAQIEADRAHRQDHQNLTLYSPASGFVTERNAFPKQHVTPETVLYTMADLSTVWVMADVFEYEAAACPPGPARDHHAARLNAVLDRARELHPAAVDPATRTLKVRLDFANPGLRSSPTCTATC